MTQVPKANTAAEAFDLYRAAYEEGRLVQSAWHKHEGGGDNGDEGRFLACALGTLGPDINNPRDCPASIMPRWLAQMVPWFFDTQSFEDATAWGLAFYAELKRLNGVVPFSVVYDWQANVVGPLAIETAEKQNRDVGTHKALAEMQWKAVTGQKFTPDEWRPILKAAFLDIYKYRYRSNAYADADAYAYAYADADADAYAYAYADADAYADAYAYAYADADAYAYAYADAYADAYAYANAYANADADAYRERVTKLAAGMVECLNHVKA